MKHIGIIGFGWLAQKISDQLQRSATLHTTTTSEVKFMELQQRNLNPDLVTLSGIEEQNEVWNKVNMLDCIIISVPFSTRDNSDYQRKKMRNLIRFLGNFDKQIILFSSTGVYPKDEKIWSEKDLDPSEVFTESYFKKRFPKIVILRLGGLMGGDRKLSRFSSGKNMEACVNHIHYEDIGQLVSVIINQEISNEVLNVVAPQHPSKKAVIDYQKSGLLVPEETLAGRIISSEKLQKKYRFVFTHPDPCLF